MSTRTADGRIIRVTGPVVDVEFPPGDLPEINHALTFERESAGRTVTVTAEVAQHIGDHRVRAVCMAPTDGVMRGTGVVNTGGPITVPVGPGTLGHIYNVLGEPLDVSADQIVADTRWSIHRDPPPFDQLESKTEMFETGIKVIDLV